MLVARVDPARLQDLEAVLSEVRAWAGVEDRGGGTFYVKGKPFLHFHVGHDSRRADVRRAGGWVQVDLPEPAPAPVRDELASLLRLEYEER